MKRSYILAPLAAVSLVFLMGSIGCTDGGKAELPDEVTTASATIKGALCTAGVALAASAAHKRGIPVDALVETDVLVAGCKSLADRLPVSATVYDDGHAGACGQFDAYAVRIADDTEALDALAGVMRDAGCSG